MKSINATLNNESHNKTEENKLRDIFNNSIRNRIISQNKNRSNYNPIRILNNKSTFQIKPKNEINSYKINNRIKQFYGERNINYVPFNLKKSKNSKNENNEQRDNLIIQLYHITMDMNQVDKEIKELKNLFSHEEKENMAHKFIINKILNENQNVKVVEHKFDSPKNTKNKSFAEENNNENKSKNSTIKVSSVKKGFFSKNFNILEKNKNRTIPNSIKKIKTRNSKSKIDTLKKELDFYQKMIESKEEKLKNFNKKEGTMIYKGINLMIDKQNKNFENLNKIGNEIINKVFQTDEKIFELSQKLYKKKKKNKEQSELNSLINEKKILEEKYDKKAELKIEENDYKIELENLNRDEKKYKLKIEVNELKLEHCQKKNKELNQKIEEYEKERSNLLEQSKVPRRNKIKIEEMENELEKLVEEIENYEKKLIEMNK